MSKSSAKPDRLITIPVSHYCEKARWALTRLQIPFVEEAHMPPFHRFATRGLAQPSAAAPGLSPLNRWVLKQVGGQTVPVLVTSTGILHSSDEILHYVDNQSPPELKLYPTDAQARQQVDQLVETFDTVLAPAVRVWTYSYIMNQPHLVKPLWCQRVPWFERLAFTFVFPWMKTNVIQLYGISETSASESYQMIGQVFDQVDQLLADGRPFLTGNRFSAADLAFATLAAAVVSPAGYGVKLPKLSQLLPPMATGIEQFRATAAGKFVLWLYEERDQVARRSR
jgi:glutathione S-transferase